MKKNQTEYADTKLKPVKGDFFILFNIALRNVMRHAKRTLLTVITMAAGISMFIAMESLLRGLDRGSIDNIANLSNSSLRVMSKEYASNAESFPLDFGIENPASVKKALLQDTRIVAVTERTKFIGELINSEQTKAIVCTIINPESDKDVFSLTQNLNGNYFSGLTNEILLGQDLANELKLKLNDTIILASNTLSGTQNADTFTVSGIVITSDPSINRLGAYISYKDAEKLLELNGLVTELDVKTVRLPEMKKFIAESASIKKDFLAMNKDLSAFSLSDAAELYLAIVTQKQKFSYVFILIILVIAGIGIINTVLMSVYSRIREIGVLRAFGLRKKEIKRLFLLEGTIMGFMGGIFGVVIGIVLVALLVNIGISMDSLAGKIDTGSFPIWGMLYGEWNLDSMIVGFIFCMLVALISSLIPARKAASLEISETLRFI